LQISQLCDFGRISKGAAADEGVFGTVIATGG